METSRKTNESDRPTRAATIKLLNIFFGLIINENNKSRIFTGMMAHTNTNLQSQNKTGARVAWSETIAPCHAVSFL